MTDRQVAEKWLVNEGWERDVAEGLSPWISALSAEKGRPIAVFDFDNTLIMGDIGELYSQYLIDEVLYRYDLDAFWGLIDPEDGRDRLRQLATEIWETPRSEQRTHPLYDAYRREASELYRRRFDRLGRRDCYEWAVKLHVGIEEAQMARWSRAAMARELGRRRQRVSLGESDRGEVEVQRGIRVIAQMRRLLQRLMEEGVEVWIVSASNEWTVRAVAPLFGVPEQRVLGNRVTVNDRGQLTDQREGPVVYREGKVALIESVIGSQPQLAAGDAITDKEMLEFVDGPSLLIDRGDEAMRLAARERDWLVQPQERLDGMAPTPPWEDA